jgi:hypothetical protein
MPRATPGDQLVMRPEAVSGIRRKYLPTAKLNLGPNIGLFNQQPWVSCWAPSQVNYS